MAGIEKLREEILPKAKVFFNSIESQAANHENNTSKHNSYVNILLGSFLIMALNILPAIPYEAKKIRINWDFEFYGVTIPLSNFFLRWLVFSIIFSLIFFGLLLHYKKLIKRQKKFGLNEKQVDFSNLCKCIKELEVLIINDRIEHSENALKYLKKYVQKSFLSKFQLVKDKFHYTFLPKYLSTLKSTYFWIDYSIATQNIIDGFICFDELIYKRIAEHKDLNLVVEILEDLMIYEFLKLGKILPESLDESFTDKKAVNMILIEHSADKLNNLDILDQVAPDQSRIFSLETFKEYGTKFSNAFSHDNILYTFFAWFVLFALIFIACLYFGHIVYKLTIDSTIYIGAISGVLACSITIAATIYGKKK